MNEQQNMDISITDNNTALTEINIHGVAAASVSDRPADADEPGPPLNLTAVTAGLTQINLSWEAVDAADRYNVYRSITTSGPYTLVNLTVSPFYNDMNLTPNTTYYYRVTAVTGDTEGPLSNMASATTEGDISTPTNVLATPISDTQINTTWNPVPYATAYAVYRSTTPEGTYQYIASTAEPSFSDMGLIPSTTYYYRIAAIVNGAAGAASAYAAATTFPSASKPPIPKNVHAQPLSCTEILITWDGSADAEAYYVYCSYSVNGPYQLVNVTTSAAYIAAGLSPCTTCYFCIQAYAGGLFSSHSAAVCAATPACGSPLPPCRNCCPRCGCNPCCCPRERSTDSGSGK